MEQAWFIPGRLSPPLGPLARYRPIQPVGAVGSYVRALTRPGDLVVDLFCQGPTVVREAVAAGRRALGFSVNPLLLAVTRLGLERPDPDALNAAFTRLVDSPKGDVPLHHYLASLYRSACPACEMQGTAEWFAWDRDGHYPFKKAVRCPQCGDVQEGAPDDQDREAAFRVQPRGLAYYRALDRVAPLGHPARERAAELVELYTPRNLSALMDLSSRLETLEAEEEIKLALAGALLDCFDASAGLAPYGEKRPRPRMLRLPARYLERNVWLCFEQGFSRLLAEEPSALPPDHPPIQQAADAAALLRGETGEYALVSHAARDVRKTISPESAALIFTDPPRPDAIFWALSALWAGWLWESPSVQALRPFLNRRRFDWDWHWRVLRAALRAAGPLLTPQGHLITLFSEPDKELLESVCLATSSAGYVLEGWGHSPEVGHRLVWRWDAKAADHQLQVAARDVEPLKRAIAAKAEEAAVNTLCERGEPTHWALLHASIYTGLSRRGWLSRAAAIPEGGDSPRAFTFAAEAVRDALKAPDAPIARLADQEGAEEGPWWLVDTGQVAGPVVSEVEPPVVSEVEPPVVSEAEPPVVSQAELPLVSQVEPPVMSRVEPPVVGRVEPPVVSRVEPPVVSRVEPPLADRVGTQVWELLTQRPVWDLEELVETIYARFPDRLTPDLALVLVCIDSYSAQEEETFRLRPEDDPLRRSAERRTVRDGLAELGRRLGFEVPRGDGWDVRWIAEGQEAYVFAVSTMVALGRHLLTTRPAGKEAQRCLVMPGGRAGLVSLKVQRDPRLARAVAVDGWQFIKFRHLRRLLAEEALDRHALKTVLGLDPIAEQEAAQIPLF